MHSPDQSSEITLIQSQLDSLSLLFDKAVANDANLGELKKIFHQIRLCRDKLEKLDNTKQKDSE
jgi:hypothetical protein